MKIGSHELTPVRFLGGILGLIGFALLESLDLGLEREAKHAAAISVLMLCWWFTEALPIHWTALVPLFTFPLLAVFPAETVETSHFFDQLLRTVQPYVDPSAFLFFGGMSIAAAMERWNLHRRIALSILAAIGGGSSRLILGTLCATAFISLWISNTAAAVMMLPIGIALIRRLEEEAGKALRHFGLAVMLSIAYGANVGGIGTKIGTVPNAVFCQSAEKLGVSIDFLDFLAIGLPFVLLFLPVIWWVLVRVAKPDSQEIRFGADVIETQKRALGPMSLPEKWIGAVFLLTASLWISGKPLSEILGFSSSSVFDACVSIFAMLLLLLVPLPKHGRALNRAALAKIPYSVLLLLGGSFAMAEGLGESGLIRSLEPALQKLATLDPWLAFLGVAFLSVFFSAAASNTATTALMMGVLRAVFPSQFAIPAMATATIAASCDFMLPAGTPPNAIVFGSGYVKIQSMIRIGFVLDLIAALLAGLWGWFGVRYLFA